MKENQQQSSENNLNDQNYSQKIKPGLNIPLKMSFKTNQGFKDKSLKRLNSQNEKWSQDQFSQEYYENNKNQDKSNQNFTQIHIVSCEIKNDSNKEFQEFKNSFTIASIDINNQFKKHFQIDYKQEFINNDKQQNSDSDNLKIDLHTKINKLINTEEQQNILKNYQENNEFNLSDAEEDKMKELLELERAIEQPDLTRGERRRLQNKKNVLKAKIKKELETEGHKSKIENLKKKILILKKQIDQSQTYKNQRDALREENIILKKRIHESGSKIKQLINERQNLQQYIISQQQENKQQAGFVQSVPRQIQQQMPSLPITGNYNYVVFNQNFDNIPEHEQKQPILLSQNILRKQNIQTFQQYNFFTKETLSQLLNRRK